jgi:hypothetical protein
MYYKHPGSGFSFELPDGWRHDPHINPLTFFGPHGYLGCNSEVIQIHLAVASAEWISPESREQLLAEPGASVFRSTLGDETNVVVLQKPESSEIDAVRDGVLYSIVYMHDEPSEQAIQRLRETFRFPSYEQAIANLQYSSDPQNQAIHQAMNAGSVEEARQILDQAGVRTKDTGGSGFVIEPRRPSAGSSHTQRIQARKKWWEFWR